MAFNINQFKSEAVDFLRPYTYEVLINPPGGGGRPLSLRTEQISLPGVAFAEVNEYKPYGNGLRIDVPHTVTGQEISCIHTIDAQGGTLQTFYDWANKIVNVDGTERFSAYYYDDYTVDGTIFIYNLKGKEVKQYRIKKMYPQAYNQVEMSWGASDVVKLSVTYKFESFSLQNAGFGIADAGGGFVAGTGSV